jgi:hypothetical protein
MILTSRAILAPAVLGSGTVASHGRRVLQRAYARDSDPQEFYLSQGNIFYSEYP